MNDMTPEEQRVWDAWHVMWAAMVRDMQAQTEVMVRALTAAVADLAAAGWIFPVGPPARPTRRRLPPARRANGHRYAMRAKGRYE